MSVDSELIDEFKEVKIKITGRFDFNQVQTFREAYQKYQDHKGGFLIDMRDVEYMDSSGLGMLLNMRKVVGGEAAKIRITNCRPQLKKILMISRFDKKFLID